MHDTISPSTLWPDIAHSSVTRVHVNSANNSLADTR